MLCRVNSENRQGAIIGYLVSHAHVGCQLFRPYSPAAKKAERLF
ncbi:hypothetical protein [uncultured Vagococcus sp.]|nr:hypothetical protein [uncultured Vagococcus sp.]